MRTKRSHLSDDEILLFIDRELSSRRRLRARNHLGDCQSCSGRMAELEAASTGFSRVHEEMANSLDSNLFRSRSLLKARLAESTTQGNRGWAFHLLHVDSMSRQLACACIALMIVGAGYWIMGEFHGNDRGAQSMEYQAFALPQRTLTPGAVLPVAMNELCGARSVENDPPVNPALQQAVFKEYGLSNLSRTAYELDYLITPALGGSGDIKNLWPQPYSSTWNSRVKDQLEDHLHELVCHGQVQLTTAQKEIASDWISAYKRYFNTDRPQPNQANIAEIHAGDWHIYRTRPSVSAWRVPAAIIALRLTE